MYYFLHSDDINLWLYHRFRSSFVHFIHNSSENWQLELKNFGIPDCSKPLYFTISSGISRKGFSKRCGSIRWLMNKYFMRRERIHFQAGKHFKTKQPYFCCFGFLKRWISFYMFVILMLFFYFYFISRDGCDCCRW